MLSRHVCACVCKGLIIVTRAVSERHSSPKRFASNHSAYTHSHTITFNLFLSISMPHSGFWIVSRGTCSESSSLWSSFQRNFKISRHDGVHHTQPLAQPSSSHASHSRTLSWSRHSTGRSSPAWLPSTPIVGASRAESSLGPTSIVSTHFGIERILAHSSWESTWLHLETRIYQLLPEYLASKFAHFSKSCTEVKSYTRAHFVTNKQWIHLLPLMVIVIYIFGVIIIVSLFLELWFLD